MTEPSPEARVAGLYRHPVKGLSPEPLAEAVLEAGRHFPGDRLFAVENGPSGYDPAAAELLPKSRFLMLMRHARLAKLRTRYDDASGRLTLWQGGAVAAAGDLRSAEGRDAVASFLEHFVGEGMRGPAKLLAAPPAFRFMDSRRGFLSLIELASVRPLAAAAGRQTLDPRRFRANILVEGLGPWGDLALLGRRVRIGAAVIAVTARTERCAATGVDPALGERDLDVVALLERHVGHHDLGVYASIVESGTVRVGDAVSVLPA